MPTRQQLGRFLIRQGLSGEFLLADDEYACPSERWIKEVFPRAFSEFKSSISQHLSLEWSAEVLDCDDFSRLAASYAALIHRATTNRPKASALAFGEFWFERKDGAGHAINIAVVANADNRPKLIFFEPQDCTIAQLSQEEVESCLAVRF